MLSFIFMLLSLNHPKTSLTKYLKQKNLLAEKVTNRKSHAKFCKICATFCFSFSTQLQMSANFSVDFFNDFLHYSCICLVVVQSFNHR